MLIYYFQRKKQKGFPFSHRWPTCSTPLLRASWCIIKMYHFIQHVRVKGTYVIVFILNHKLLRCKRTVRDKKCEVNIHPSGKEQQRSKAMPILERLLASCFSDLVEKGSFIIFKKSPTWGLGPQLRGRHLPGVCQDTTPPKISKQASRQQQNPVKMGRLQQDF